MARQIRSIDIYLPLDYNDGSAIPESKYVAIEDELLTEAARSRFPVMVSRRSIPFSDTL